MNLFWCVGVCFYAATKAQHSNGPETSGFLESGEPRSPKERLLNVTDVKLAGYQNGSGKGAPTIGEEVLSSTATVRPAEGPTGIPNYAGDADLERPKSTTKNPSK